MADYVFSLLIVERENDPASEKNGVNIAIDFIERSKIDAYDKLCEAIKRSGVYTFVYYHTSFRSLAGIRHHAGYFREDYKVAFDRALSDINILLKQEGFEAYAEHTEEKEAESAT